MNAKSNANCVSLATVPIPAAFNSQPLNQTPVCMKSKIHSAKSTRAFAALLLALSLTALSPALATTNDWVGGGADGFTYTSGNWQTNGVTSGAPWQNDIARWNSVSFTKQYTNNNNMLMGKLYFAATLNNAANIYGSGSSKTISLYGINGVGIQVDAGSANVACSGTLLLTVAANQTWTNNASLTVNAPITAGTNSSGIQLTNIQLTVDGTGTSSFGGWISDRTTTNQLSVVKNGSGILNLASFGLNPNIFSGGLTLNAGTLNVTTATNTLGSGNLTINGGTFNIANNNYPNANGNYPLNNGNVIINGGTIDSTYNSTTIKSNSVTYNFANNFAYGGTRALGLGAVNTVNLTTNCTITATNYNWLSISGPVNGNYSLTRDGGNGGILVMSGAGNYSGGTVIRNSYGPYGALYLGADNPLGTGALTISNANGVSIASVNTTARLLTNAVVFADGPVLGNAAQNGALTFSGPVQMVGGVQHALNIQSPVTFSGNVSGNGGISKWGGSTLTISGNCTCPLGTTIVYGTLALSGSALITNTASITVSNSAIFDVSGLSSPFTLAQSLSSQTLSNSAPGAIINGTNNCSAGTISLVYDGVNPAFNLASGGMTLSAATAFRVNNTGAQLTNGGSYKLIANGGTGLVAGAVTASPVTVDGNGAAGTATLAITGGELFLNVASSTPAPAVLTNTVSGNSLVLNWPAGQGWTLQSNSVSLTDTNSWHPVTGATPPATNVIDPTKPAVFFRLKY